ncbi:hypothetical protein RSOL_162460 [Rhizoctonia solani AG-3 Rhs1AP]|uniref:Uncharacterized protein n=1 Tax=Rhizoctonia solani AG-3 Rhs1AP TaxID=1086054 RepID=X8J2I8_9AGAM|nr:hypothetical protein RSOL_162460 [Rhizoctonia solani AG-3 Rhs1AP]
MFRLIRTCRVSYNADICATMAIPQPSPSQVEKIKNKGE